MPSRPTTAEERLTTLGLLAEVWSALETRAAGALACHGVSAVEFGVLLRLSRTPGHRLRMTDLTAQTALTTSGTTRVVDRLSAAGLVCREACPTDRRSIYAVLTPAGAERVAAALPGHDALIEQALVGPLGAAGLRDLAAHLRTLRDALHPGATAGVASAQTPAPA